MQAVREEEDLEAPAGNHQATATMNGAAKVRQTAIQLLPTVVLINAADVIHQIVVAVITTAAIPAIGKAIAAITVLHQARDIHQEVMAVIGIAKQETTAGIMVQAGLLKEVARVIPGEGMKTAAAGTAEVITTETREIAAVECRIGIHPEETAAAIHVEEEGITTAGKSYQPIVLINCFYQGPAGPVPD